MLSIFNLWSKIWGGGEGKYKFGIDWFIFNQELKEVNEQVHAMDERVKDASDEEKAKFQYRGDHEHNVKVIIWWGLITYIVLQFLLDLMVSSVFG